MAVRDNRLLDGMITCEGGVDSGFAPSLIQPNQVAWAVNTTVRGGYPTSRPGWWKRPLKFPSPDTGDLEDLFDTGLWQGCGTYVNDDGVAFLAVSISGRICLISIQNYAVTEITIPGDVNTVNLTKAWFVQAERWLIVQNGLNPPFLYDGASSRRATATEVPIGGPMAYGKGRLWVANGSLYYGGDLVWSDMTAGRDSVIKFTENTFLNEGGAFAVANGPITGLAFAANLDTALGDGDLLVFTPGATYAFSAPVDREVWKDLQYPIQRFALLNFGSYNHESIVPVNGDLFFRSQDGIRSLIYARRDFGEWGNTPISRQMIRALQFDSTPLLGSASAINFDNRFLLTTQPQQVNGRGIYHRGLAVLDFNLVSGMGVKSPPAWEGVWTGCKIMQAVSVIAQNTPRAFLFSLEETGDFALYEITKDGQFDYDGLDDVRTEWIFESRSFFFGQPSNLKRLWAGEMWYDRMMGQVNFTTKYRANESECWNVWTTFNDCAEYRSCTGYPCQEIQYYKPAARSRIGLPQPGDQNDPQTGGFTRDGYEFQVRFEFLGRCRLKKLVLAAEPLQEDLFGDIAKAACVEPTDVDCQTDCLALECAGVCSEPPDYDYQIYVP
jgi:hypothetical protein